MLKKLLSITSHLLLLLLVSTQLQAQSSLTFDASQVFANFRFINSAGTLNNSLSPIMSNAYSIGYRYEHKTGFLLGANVGTYNCGASKTENGEAILWNLQYVSAKLQVGYILDKWRIRPFYLLSPYFNYLAKAIQSRDGVNYDIIKDNVLNRIDIGLTNSIGVQYDISNSVGIYASYNYILGLSNLETQTSQILRNRANSFSLGVSLLINKKSIRR